MHNIHLTWALLPTSTCLTQSRSMCEWDLSLSLTHMERETTDTFEIGNKNELSMLHGVTDAIALWLWHPYLLFCNFAPTIHHGKWAHSLKKKEKKNQAVALFIYFLIKAGALLFFFLFPVIIIVINKITRTKAFVWCGRHVMFLMCWCWGGNPTARRLRRKKHDRWWDLGIRSKNEVSDGWRVGVSRCILAFSHSIQFKAGLNWG